MLVATAIAATSAQSMASGSSISYEIQPGDTLTAIAAQHDISVDELVQINSIADPDSIPAGAELLLKDESGVQVGDTVYQIREGDTLHGIAVAHDVSLQDILDLNGIDQEDVIYAGDSIVIPTGERNDVDVAGDPVPEGEPYEVQEGDTLSSIAAAHDVSLSDLIDANTIENQDVIHPGDMLTIPNGEQDILDDQDEDDTDLDVESGNDAGDGPAAADDHIISLHLVARGETLSAVAQRYGVELELLALANDIQDYDRISVGDMLRIPDPAWAPVGGPETGNDSAEMLDGLPAMQQSVPLSSGAAAMEMVTTYWGYPVSEWVFIENLPEHENPHRGFRGDLYGAVGGTDNYGVYAKPLSAILANYGFVGDEFYTMGEPDELTARIDDGQPVVVWITSDATEQQRFDEWHEGERFALAPYQQAVVVYGYDEDHVHVADPAAGEYRTFTWDEFLRSWSTFDGMSLAVRPIH